MQNKLKKILIKIDKFISGKFLGRKYIRTGKCKACGRCCQSIYVRHSRHIIKDPEEFEQLKSQHFFYTYLKIVDKTEDGLVFECTKLDKESGRCGAYDRRPLLCRQYPLEEIFMMGGVISEECGFDFEPIKSFEDVFQSALKKK